MLDAFALVINEINDIDLVIGGGSPKPKQRELGVFEKMRAIIKEKNMEEKVKIIGYVSDEDMAANYQQSELFVLPSLFEPFGMTTQEAMACGRPVVASKFGGIRNVINTDENGILVDPKNPKEFANAMIKVLTNKTFSDKIGNAAYKTIQDEYSWEAIAQRHLSFYQI